MAAYRTSGALTSSNLVAAYRSAYYSLHSKYPNEVRCLSHERFVVDGTPRTRLWMLIEVKRLRHLAIKREEDAAIAPARDTTTPKDERSGLLRLISHISRLKGTASAPTDPDKTIANRKHPTRKVTTTTELRADNAAARALQMRKGTGQTFFPPDAVLVLEMERDRLRLRLNQDLLIGRSSPPFGSYHFVDMQPYGGYRSGISRKHATISRNVNNALELMDLGSSNGTTINGARIIPRQAYILHDGDRITFGEFSVLLYFEVHAGLASTAHS